MYHGHGGYGFAGPQAGPQRAPSYPPPSTASNAYHHQQQPRQEACYNCGNGSHWAQNCPEPRRAVPAGSLKKSGRALNRGGAPPALKQPALNTLLPATQQAYHYNNGNNPGGYASPQTYGPPTPVSGYGPHHGMPSPGAYCFSPATPSTFSPYQTQHPWSAPATPYPSSHNTPPLAHGPFAPHSQIPSPVTPSTPYGQYPFGGAAGQHHQQPHQPSPAPSPGPEKQKTPVMLNNTGAVWVPAQPTSRPLEPTFTQSEARGLCMPPRLHTPGTNKRASVSAYIDHSTLETGIVHVSASKDWTELRQDPVFSISASDQRISLDAMKEAVQKRAGGATTIPETQNSTITLADVRPIDGLMIRTSPEPIVHSLPPRPRDISLDTKQHQQTSRDSKSATEETSSYGWLKRNQKPGAGPEVEAAPSISPKSVRKISLSEYAKSRRASSNNPNESAEAERSTSSAKHSTKSSTDTVSSLATSASPTAGVEDTPLTSAFSSRTSLPLASDGFSQHRQKSATTGDDGEAEFGEEGMAQADLASFGMTAMNASRKRTRAGRESRDVDSEYSVGVDAQDSNENTRPTTKRVCS